MKPITEDTFVGFTVKGEPIKAERLSKWAYNQIAAPPELLEACKSLMAKDTEAIEKAKAELFRLAPELKPMFEKAIAKAEGRAE